jgi:hypothetical protein
MCRVVDGRISLQEVRRGKPTVSRHRKAAVLGARGRVRRTPPGSKSGAWLHRGRSGTWESPLSPCHSAGMGDRRSKALAGAGASTRARARTGHHARTEAGKVAGRERPAKGPERGRVAVVAEYSTDESGELRPKGPRGGKATPGITRRRTDRRERR